MKGLILFTAAIYLAISIPDSHAGIAGLITSLLGECNPADKNGVQLCSQDKDGKIYYMYKGVRYETYPHIK